jgi:hypothetical protein
MAEEGEIVFNFFLQFLGVNDERTFDINSRVKDYQSVSFDQAEVVGSEANIKITFQFFQGRGELYFTFEVVDSELGAFPQQKVSDGGTAAERSQADQ